MTTYTHPYTVTEYGVRYADGHVDSLGAGEEYSILRTARKLPALVTGQATLVERTVTGRDVLLGGARAPKLKAKYAAHPGSPDVVDSATEWERSTR